MEDVVQTQDQTSLIKGKGKQASNLLADVATEVENLTKSGAHKLAAKLVEEKGASDFRLGGVLKVIYENSWFDGYENFGTFVTEKYGFQERKARYLMDIYTNLVKNQIPWEKVQHLGWTKLKEIAKFLTVDNVDDWVGKVENLSFSEMTKMLANTSEGGEGQNKKATSDSHKLNFVLKADQLEIIQQALAKAKGESGTEFDSVALELICTGYLGNSVALAADQSTGSLEDAIKAAGFETAIQTVDKLWPDLKISFEQ